MDSDDRSYGIVRIFTQYRHLLLFGVPGMLLLTAGVAWGLRVVDIFCRKRALLVGSAMISVLLSIVGALALFTGTMLHSVRQLLADQPEPEEAESEGQAADRPQAVLQALRSLLRRRPLIVFGGPGTVLLGAGAGWGMRVIVIMQKTRQLAIGSALVCMVLSIIGSLAILAGIILHSVHGLLADLARNRTRS